MILQSPMIRTQTSLRNFRGSGNSFTREGYRVKGGGRRKKERKEAQHSKVCCFSVVCVVRDRHFGLATKWSHLSSLQAKTNSSNLLVWNFQGTKDKDKKEIMGQKAIVNLHKPD